MDGEDTKVVVIYKGDCGVSENAKVEGPAVVQISGKTVLYEEPSPLFGDRNGHHKVKVRSER